MHNRNLIFHESRISYYRWGRGPRLLLCFHGYGESATGFSFLEDILGDAFTILAIDLPFHGLTDWKEPPLTPTTLLTIIDEILAAESPCAPPSHTEPSVPAESPAAPPSARQSAVSAESPSPPPSATEPPIPAESTAPPPSATEPSVPPAESTAESPAAPPVTPRSSASNPGSAGPAPDAHSPGPGEGPAPLPEWPPQKDWWLLGYSLGGRIALSLLETAPGKIGRLLLLAPDGLVVNPWYWLATRTRPGRQLFKWTMYHPGWFFFMLRTGNKLGLVNPSVYKFVANYVDNKEIRSALYIRWTALRIFKPRLAVIKDIIRSRRLPVQLLYGKFDRIIRVERGESFRKGIEPWCELTVIPAGHQLLKKDHIQALLHRDRHQAVRPKDRL